MTTFSRTSLNCLAAAFIITLGFASTSHAALILGLNAKDIIQADNTTVSSWTGVGSASQGAAVFQPIFRSSVTALNGNASVDFDAINDGMSTSVGAATITSLDFTVMSLYSWKGGAAANRRVVQGSSNWLIGPYSGTHQLFNGGFVNSGDITSGSPVISTVTGNSFYLDGTLVGTGSSGSPGAIGLGGSGAFLEPADSDVGLVLVFDAALTNDERVGVEWHMAVNFGVSGFSATDTQIQAGSAALNGFLPTTSPVAGPILVDFNTTDTANSPTATAADFASKGVTGLTGTETVDIFAMANFATGSPTIVTDAGVLLTFGEAYSAFSLSDAQVAGGGGGLGFPLDSASEDLMRDYLFIAGPAMPVTIGNLDLAPNTQYTLYLFGNLDPAFNHDSIFTPMDGDVTFSSFTSIDGQLEVIFTTGATWDSLSTIDFMWDNEDPDGDFNGFAIVLAPSQATAPEPSSVLLLALGCLGLPLLTRHRRRSCGGSTTAIRTHTIR